MKHKKNTIPLREGTEFSRLREKLKRQFSVIRKCIFIPMGIFADYLSISQLWKGDTSSFLIPAMVVGILLIFGNLAYLAFKNIPGTIDSRFRVPAFPQLFRVARVVLVAMLLLVVGVIIGLMNHRIEMGKKFIVLVTSISGPDPASYRVNELLIASLRQAFRDDNNAIVVGIDDEVAEQSGEAEARALGERYQAKLVLWGWYGVTNSNALIAIHIESMLNSKYTDVGSAKQYSRLSPCADISNYSLQSLAASELTCYALFVVGVRHYESGDYRGAVERFSASLAHREWAANLASRAWAYFFRGTSAWHLRQEDVAVADFDTTLALDPNLVRAYYNRGTAYFDLGDWDKALADYENSKRYEPNYSQGWIAHALTLLKKGKPNDAIADLNHVIATNPREAVAYCVRGVAQFDLGMQEEAIKEYTKAIEIDSSVGGFYQNRCVSLMNMNRLAEAKADVEKLLRLEPSYGFGYLQRGTIYMMLGHLQEASKDLSKAIELDSTLVDAYFNRGVLLQEIGSYNDALGDYERVIRLSPATAADAHNNRGGIYSILGMHEQAVTEFTKVLVLNPVKWDALCNRGWAYAMMGAGAHAASDFHEVIRKSKDENLRKRSAGGLQMVSRQ